ncbi:MAG: hypothetical protein IK997_03215 [Bacilli bacterium]|nr:hypothetical protein [Bacilli bacterium]
MERRMQRYDEVSENPKVSRRQLNQELYNRLNDNSSVTTYTDINKANQYVLDAASKNYRTREGYQKLKEYGDLVPKPKVKKELDDFTNLYKETENKVYDINSVIEEAKRNRKTTEEELKRKLKNYNILSNISDEKIEEYKKNRKKVVRANEDEIKEIINTITTKAINGEIDQETSVNLLSDLMATQQLDMVEGIDLSEENKEEIIKKNEEKFDSINTLSSEDIKEVEEKKIEDDLKDKEYQEKNQSKNIFKDMDQSFYTRSMDLSDKDFDIDNDEEKVKKKHPILKFFIILIIMAIIGVLVYYFRDKIF